MDEVMLNMIKSSLLNMTKAEESISVLESNMKRLAVFASVVKHLNDCGMSIGIDYENISKLISATENLKSELFELQRRVKTDTEIINEIATKNNEDKKDE